MFRHVDKMGCVFERRSYRVPGEKYPKAETKCIGKMVDGEFLPNAYFIERTAKENLEKELAEVKEQLKTLTQQSKKETKKEKKIEEVASVAVSSRKKEGGTYAIEKIAEQEYIMTALEETFGKEDASEIMTIIEYIILTESSAFDDFNYFHDSHTHKHARNISSTEFSRFLSKITEEKVNLFFRNLDKLVPKNGKGDAYCSFDSTAISSYSEELSDVEVSKGKQDPDLKHLCIAAAHSSLTKKCGYYRLYRGNIPDIKTIDNFVDEMKGWGFSFKKSILDRGYMSMNNIHRLHVNLKAEVMGMLPSSFGVFKTAVNRAKKSLVKDSAHYIEEQQVYGETYPETIKYKVGEEEFEMYVYIHVFFSEARKDDETRKLHEELTDRIIALNLDFENGKISYKDAINRNFTANHKSCIKVTKLPGRKVRFEKDNAAIDEALALAGYFCILSTELMKAAEAILRYRTRDGVERVFNILKNDLSFRRCNVKTDETLQGKVFCTMLGTMIVSTIREKMSDARKEGKIKGKLTYHKLVKELECIYSYKVGEKTLWSEISERQKTIFSFLGIDLPAEPKVVKVTKQYVKKKPI